MFTFYYIPYPPHIPRINPAVTVQIPRLVVLAEGEAEKENGKDDYEFYYHSYSLPCSPLGTPHRRQSVHPHRYQY